MIYLYKGEDISPSYVMGGIVNIPIADMMKIIRSDMDRMSDYIHDLENIDYVLRCKCGTPIERKKYIRSIGEDIESYLNEKHRYSTKTLGLNTQSLHYDILHLYPLVCGQKYIVTPPDHFNKQDYSEYISDEIFDEDCVDLCFSGKNMYTNIVVMLQKTGNKISFDVDDQNYKGDEYRLSLASVQNRDGRYIIPIAEYLLERRSFIERRILFSEYGSVFCSDKCKTKGDVIVSIDDLAGDTYKKNCCMIKKEESRMICACRQLNPVNYIGAIGYALYHARNRENVDMYETVKNAECKHGSVATCDIIDDFGDLDEYPLYHIIRVSPNYHYDIDQDDDNYSNRPHKSPIEHYRKGTPVIINKNGTVYSRRSTIVNKGNSDSLAIYSL